MKKLLAFVLMGGLFALGCSGTTSTPKKTGIVPSPMGTPSPKESPKEIKPSAKEAPPKKEEGKLKLDVPKSVDIAADKDSADLVVKVTQENVEGAVTVKAAASEGLKVDPESQELKKGDTEAKFKVTADKRDNEVKGKITVTATAEKAKEEKAEVPVTAAKKAAK